MPVPFWRRHRPPRRRRADPAVKSKLDEVRARGKVIVGVTSEAPPFGFIDEKGELVGFDIDVAKLIAKGIFGDDTKIELMKQGFAARWPNTQNGTGTRSQPKPGCHKSRLLVMKSSNAPRLSLIHLPIPGAAYLPDAFLALLGRHRPVSDR